MISERAFYEGLRAWRHVPFDWPTTNCCHFAKDMLERQGIDVPLEVPEVSGPEEAAAWLKARGYQNLYRLLIDLFGKSVAPLQGRRGDLAYHDGAIGVIDRSAWFLGDHGLVSMPLTRIRRAFRVRPATGG